jgi:hypothetical protein
MVQPEQYPGQSRQVSLTDQPGGASWTGWPEHDRKDRASGKGQPINRTGQLGQWQDPFSSYSFRYVTFFGENFLSS